MICCFMRPRSISRPANSAISANWRTSVSSRISANSRTSVNWRTSANSQTSANSRTWVSWRTSASLADIGQLADVGQLADMGQGCATCASGTHVRRLARWLRVSAHPDLGVESLRYPIHEATGPYYLLVKPHNGDYAAQPYRLRAQILPDEARSPAITAAVPVSFALPAVDANIKTLILVNSARTQARYAASDPTGAAALAAKLQALAAQSQVHGKVIALDSYPELVAAYAIWDAQPTNPNAANYVAQAIKSLLYRLAPAYRNLQYLVIIGGDDLIPYFRVADEARVANERNYAGDVAANPLLAQSASERYLLTDDYYAGLLPIAYRGRELYLPQLSIGRLVETPSDIVRQINTFLAAPSVDAPTALLTGYDFLTDEAEAIASLMQARGIAVTKLINDTWTAGDLRSRLFVAGAAAQQLSLNGHFRHGLLIPALSSGGNLLASEVTGAATDFSRSLVFSVGCHSGLNVPGGAPDWAQAFAAKGATFIGNSGFGYGDSDLIVYSEALALNFAAIVNAGGGTAVPIGDAVRQAKQRYFNSLGPNSLSNYDEKVLAIWTLYGLPMRRVRVPAGVNARPEVGAEAVSNVAGDDSRTQTSADKRGESS